MAENIDERRGAPLPSNRRRHDPAARSEPTSMNGTHEAGVRSLGHGFPAREFGRNDAALDLRQILSSIARYRRMLVAVACGSLLAGFGITAQQTPLYRTTAQLEVMAPSAKLFRDMDAMAETDDARAFRTAVQKLRSSAVAERVVDELGLADETASSARPSALSVAGRIRRHLFGTTAEPEASVEQWRAEAVDGVRRGLEARLITNTSIVTVSFRGADPKMAQAIANQVAQSFIDETVADRTRSSRQAREFVREQVQLSEDRLQASESALIAYAKSEGLALGDDNESLILANLRDVNQALGEAARDRLAKSRWVEQIDAGYAADLPQIVESTAVGALRDKIAQLRAEYRRKSVTFKPGYPEMVELSAYIDGLERQVAHAVSAAAKTMRTAYRDAETREGDLQARLVELEGRQSDFRDRNIRYTILKREVDSNRAQYEALIAEANQIEVSAQIKHPTARIVEPAALPTAPDSPNLKLNLALALALGFAFSGGAIYLRELLDDTFRDPSQVEAELGLPVLASIPRTDGRLIALACDDPRSPLSEAYRSLRAAVQFHGAPSMPQTLLVTSTQGAEGKSTTSYKLAEDFAALGARVLVIDADLRKHDVGPAVDVGLSNLLANAATAEELREILQPTRFDNVRLLAAGPTPPNPSDLLSSRRMAQLMNVFSDHFDLIVIDGPPIAAISDTQILGRLADAAVLVVEAGRTRAEEVRRGLGRLRVAEVEMLGVVLTKFGAIGDSKSYPFPLGGRTLRQPLRPRPDAA